MDSMDIAKARVREWTSGPLNLANLGLTELPELPSGLTELHCYHNQLLSLPDTLPATLQFLYYNSNRLTTLSDTLPATLQFLYCNSNRLTTLPDTLPTGLRVFYCSHNQLTTLPETLPADFTQFWCSNNAFPNRDNDEKLYEYIHRVNAIAETASKERITQRCALYFEELAKTVWHPQRVERLMLAGVDMEDM